MNINLPSFNMKNFIKEAGNSISRAVQLTEEKLGTTERTEYDAEFQSLAEHADITKIWTEKILKNTESVLVPNPQNRIEDFIYEKFDKTKRHRLSNLEHLALDMLEAGGDFGQDLPYGQALIKVGQAEQRLGRCERDFIGSSSACFTEPLRKFLDGDMKIITKERGILESKRLDLDACKNRVKKARSMLGQQAAERDLRVAQSEFDRQSELTKTLLESISMSHNDHLRHLYAFVEAQVRYYKQCMDVMDNLQNELASSHNGFALRINKDKKQIFNYLSLGGPIRYVPVANNDAVLTSLPSLHAKQLNANRVPNNVKSQTKSMGGSMTTINTDDMRRAKVLCSYDAKDHTELTLTANEVICVTECSPPHADYMYGRQGLLKGLVPRVFLEMLDQEDNNKQPICDDTDY